MMTAASSSRYYSSMYHMISEERRRRKGGGSTLAISSTFQKLDLCYMSTANLCYSMILNPPKSQKKYRKEICGSSYFNGFSLRFYQ